MTKMFKTRGYTLEMQCFQPEYGPDTGSDYFYSNLWAQTQSFSNQKILIMDR